MLQFGGMHLAEAERAKKAAEMEASAQQFLKEEAEALVTSLEVSLKQS